MTHKAIGGLTPDDVQWVVNDSAELGVKIGNQFFFLYKGRSLVYGWLDDDPTKPPVHDDDGTPMHWRPVFKREFGECAHPINYKNPRLIGTVSLDDSDEWNTLPAAKLDRSPTVVEEEGVGRPIVWHDACATDGCMRIATQRFEYGGVGTSYCDECMLKIAAALSLSKPEQAPSPVPQAVAWQNMWDRSIQINEPPEAVLGNYIPLYASPLSGGDTGKVEVTDGIRICPERDGPCPHGMACPYTGDRWRCDIGASRAALRTLEGKRT